MNISQGIARHCKRTRESYFEQYKHATFEGRDGRYIYLKRGGSQLAIAHLDCVQEDGRARIFKNKADSIIQSYALDDRLGVYILTDLLPAMGVNNYDILLTENEEQGRSTADDFETDKFYNWMFQFDRRGVDSAVMYQYQNDDSISKLEKHGIRTEIGSYSDISNLEYLGIIGFNFSCGYYDEHTKNCHAKTSGVLSSVLKFKNFWQENKDIKMIHTPIPYGVYDYNDDYTKYNIYYDDDYDNDKDDYEGYNFRQDSLRGDSFCISCGLKFNPADLTNNLCMDCLHPLWWDDRF